MTDIWLQPVHCQDERSLLLRKRLEAFSICDVNGHQLFISCKETLVQFVRQSPILVHVSCDESLAGFDAAGTAGIRRAQSHPAHILHVVMPMLLPPLADRAGESVDSQERYIGALPGANDDVQ